MVLTEDWTVEFELTRSEVHSWLRHVQGRMAAVELGPRQVKLELLGLRISSPGVNRLILWSAFGPLQEDDDCFFLPFKPTGVVILPRRAFASFEQAEAFRCEFAARIHQPWNLSYSHGTQNLRS